MVDFVVIVIASYVSEVRKSLFHVTFPREFFQSCTHSKNPSNHRSLSSEVELKGDLFERRFNVACVMLLTSWISNYLMILSINVIVSSDPMNPEICLRRRASRVATVGLLKISIAF